MQEMLTTEMLAAEEAIPQEAAPTLPSAAQETPTTKNTEKKDFLADAKVQNLIAAYTAEHGELNLEAPGVAELLSEYADLTETNDGMQSIVLRQLVGLNPKSADAPESTPETEKAEAGTSEQPETNAEKPESAEKETKAEVPAPEAETKPISPETLGSIVEQAKRFEALTQIDIANPDFYALLNTDDTAELTSAFRNRQKEVHPDRFNVLVSESDAISNNAEQVQAALTAANVNLSIEDIAGVRDLTTAVSQMVNRAYEVLKNPESKDIYDWYRSHKSDTLSTGQNVFQSYFMMNNDGERRSNMNRWKVQLDDAAKAAQLKQEAVSRKQKEQERWNAQREQVRRDRAESDKAKAEIPREKQNNQEQRPPSRDKYSDFKFDYEGFVRRGERKNERLDDFFNNTYKYSRNDAAANFSRAMRGDDSIDFLNEFTSMYEQSIDDDRGFVIDFADESDVLSPEEMLSLMYQAMRMPHPELKLDGIPNSVFSNLIQIDLNGDQSLKQIIVELNEKATNQRDTILSPEEQQAYQNLIGIFAQIKTSINAAQLLGQPLQIGEILKVIQEMPNLYMPRSGSLKNFVFTAIVNEVYASENPFINKRNFEL